MKGNIQEVASNYNGHIDNYHLFTGEYHWDLEDKELIEEINVLQKEINEKRADLETAIYEKIHKTLPSGFELQAIDSKDSSTIHYLEYECKIYGMEHVTKNDKDKPCPFKALAARPDFSIILEKGILNDKEERLALNLPLEEMA